MQESNCVIGEDEPGCMIGEVDVLETETSILSNKSSNISKKFELSFCDAESSQDTSFILTSKKKCYHLK